MEPAEQHLSLGPAVTPDGNGDDGVRTARLPRWTRQEILVLIQGKRVAEGRVRRGRAVAGCQLEPKWASVSSYCQRHGVNRGPVQCRKRWSNLAGDFKKIKEWEAKVRGDAAESFWVMRNDLRRERRLPGFFDREVYDILDGRAELPTQNLALALAPARAAAEEEGEEIIFDSGRSAAAEEGLFSDFEQEEGGGGGGGGDGGSSPTKAVDTEDVPTPMPLRISSGSRGIPNVNRMSPGPESGPPSEEGRKRKRQISEEARDAEKQGLENRLIDALDRYGKSLKEQLEAHDRNSRLDRDQRKDQANGLLTIFSKLADALGKIADKL